MCSHVNNCFFNFVFFYRSKQHNLDLDSVVSEQILTTKDLKKADSRVDALKEKFSLFKK